MVEPLDAGSHTTLCQAPVMEVFGSIQGEGLYAGRAQVFLRLFGCPLRCRWCDTPGSHAVPEVPRGRGWASAFQAATRVSALDPEARRSVSLTGGEPLCWPGFVAELKTFLGRRRLHLETAGAHPRALESVLERVDHVSLDLKLPADLEAPVPVPGAADEPVPRDEAGWGEVRRRCLRLVAGRDAAAKLVVAGGHAAREYTEILDELARLAPELPLVLQPVTPCNGVPAPSRELVAALVELALERELDTRVLPQIHRQLGLP
jgi:organic radical activating enzyme